VGMCHSTITKGNIQYHADSTHGYRGTTVELPPFDA
jgi:hypothetical protein